MNRSAVPRRPRLRVLSLVLVAAMAFAAAPPQDPTPTFFDDESMMPDCTQLTPQNTPSVSGVTDSGAHVALDVRVMLDTEDTLAVAKQLRSADTAAKKAAANAALAKLVDTYRPQVTAGDQSFRALDVGYRLSFDLYRPFNSDGTDRDRTTESARDAQKLIAGAKAQYGGRRPVGTDVVYVLTDQDIFVPSLGDGVVGLADCIGGVAWADHAFAVGEIFPGLSLGPARFYREGTAKIMAHEIGHLMGAHHHYQSCGPHAAGEALAGGVGACSLMTNFVDFTTFEFSPLNGGVVRSSAVRYADGLADELD